MDHRRPNPSWGASTAGVLWGAGGNCSTMFPPEEVVACQEKKDEAFRVGWRTNETFPFVELHDHSRILHHRLYLRAVISNLFK